MRARSGIRADKTVEVSVVNIFVETTKNDKDSYQDKDGTCEKCPFGYSGVDCKDQFQLILTIVGTIAGILILSMMAAFIVSSRYEMEVSLSWVTAPLALHPGFQTYLSLPHKRREIRGGLSKCQELCWLSG
ncbi:mucin-13 [Dugong dugon]